MALSEALRAAAAARRPKASARAEALLDVACAAMLAREVQPEYLELVDPETLQPCEELTREALLAVAARVGDTRLIDNAILRPSAAPTEAAQKSGNPHDERLPRKAIA